MTPSHVASLRRVMDVFLRGEETVHRNGTPASPLGSGSMLYPFNILRQTEREIKMKKLSKTTKEIPKLNRKIIPTVLPTSPSEQNRMKKQNP